ncbi:MAG TPA: bifunctional Delta(1)-pyrroline-2-carboxylate/Delta(1)-piperideine-2-carboxylate reductase [Gemmatimonadaceae bacterium]|jgi:1-piperideine-2-carboxylate/1-pyrroline-2-carboxylate reductase [NAD(P)H]
MATTPIFDVADTARVLPFRPLIEALKVAAAEYAAGRVVNPERLVVPLNDDGIMLSMPAAAHDLAIHKLVNICPRNAERSQPTIYGQVMGFDADTGRTLFILDGPTVTGRRTAAMSMLGVETFRPAPKEFLLIGTGVQAGNHLQAIGELYPESRVRVKGITAEYAQSFCDAHRGTMRDLQPLTDAAIPDSVDVVITLTTSHHAVYNEPPRAGRLVIGMGAFTPEMCEIGARTIGGSALYVDDVAGAKHEAGDFIQAGVDWSTVRGISDAVANKPSTDKPFVFKTVGCAAWDLAAGRVARATLG